MPTYQYACTNCGEELEAAQKFSDDPLTECPACGGRLRKVFSAVGVVFKGSGFYKTDNRGNAGNASSTGGSNGATESKPADTKSGEAKPAETKPAETKSAAAGE